MRMLYRLLFVLTLAGMTVSSTVRADDPAPHDMALP